MISQYRLQVTEEKGWGYVELLCPWITSTQRKGLLVCDEVRGRVYDGWICGCSHSDTAEVGIVAQWKRVLIQE